MDDFDKWYIIYHKHLKNMYYNIIVNRSSITYDEFCIFVYDNSSKHISQWV